MLAALLAFTTLSFPAKPAPKPAQWPPALTAEEMDLERQVREIAVTLRAPCCPELTLAQHDSPVTMEMKARIKEMVREGKSRRQIVNALVAKYGDVILPKAAGMETMLYVLPPLLAVVLVWAVWRHLRSRRKPEVLHLNDDRWGKTKKAA
jgi:cytochrome c-type biogenesis protein CcmH/NrfF